MKRPTVVIVVSSYLVIEVFLALTNTITNYLLGFMNTELSHFILMNIVVILNIIPAFLMFKAKNIGRVLYIWGHIFSFGSAIYNLKESPQALIVMVGPIILFVFFMILLYQPAVNEYFKALKANEIQK